MVWGYITFPLFSMVQLFVVSRWFADVLVA